MKQTIILFTLFLNASASFCQSSPLPDLEANFFAVIVEDIEQSINWYSEILGFEILNKVDLPERNLKQANLKRSSILIELIELGSAVSHKKLLKNFPKKTKIKGFFKFGFFVPEFEKWIDFLKKSNVEFNGDIVTDHLTGKKMLIIKDPDGNRIQIFEK
ncbi:VOC family protein [Aquimarina gracilis]|uniref:VOC family protein n=1 Tax=Aquimarina gracilis TaxID=874422 RepID=A0ABU5ZVE7_9FLAO|nr:VOC family protein [Aquimarina gracilis]MEB3345436.1 VOC family protein [Aquimarina gracilis]